MDIKIKAEWQTLLLVQQIQDKESQLDYGFPVFLWTLDHASNADLIEDTITKAQQKLIEYAANKIADFTTKLPQLQDLLQTGSSLESLVLPVAFAELVKAEDKDKEASDVTTLLDALARAYQNQKKKTDWIRLAFEPKFRIWEGQVDIKALPEGSLNGTWIAIDREQSRPGLFLPVAGDASTLELRVVDYLDDRAKDRRILTAGEKIVASVVDLRNLYHYAATETTVPSAVQDGGVQQKFPLKGLIAAKTELQHAQDVLKTFGIEGVAKSGESLLDLVFDVSAVDAPTAQQVWERTINYRALLRKVDERVLKLAGEPTCVDARITYASLVTALWARRLRRAASAGLAFLPPLEEPREGEKAKTLPGWKLGVADADAENVEALYFLAIRSGSGAGAKWAARSLDFFDDGGDTLVGIASLRAEAADVYALACSHLKELLSPLTPNRLADLARDAIMVPKDMPDELAPQKIVRPKVGVSFANLRRTAAPLSDDGDLTVACGAWLGTRGSTDLLKSPPLQKRLVEALRTVFERDLIGGMPTVISELSRELGSLAPPLPEEAQASVVTDSCECTRSLKRVLGFRYLHLAKWFKDKQLSGSRDIVRLGRARFIGLFALEIESRDVSESELMAVFSRAWALVNARAQFFARSLDIPVLQLPETPTGATKDEQKPSTKTERTKDIPDLHGLFLQTDLPACKWGDSLHGPAAYLVDILEFVRHRELEPVSKCEDNRKTKSALSVLFERRPDLMGIDLTDPNSQTLLPFIDLVCEILEAAVAPDDYLDVDFRKEISHQSSLSIYPALKEKLPRELLTRGLWLGDDAQFTCVEQPWNRDCCPPENTACCPAEVFILRDKVGLALKFYRLKDHSKPSEWNVSILPQTTLSTRELKAEPQYLNSAAYIELAESTRGYSLPWSLGEAQLAAYLQLVQLTREHIWQSAVLPQFKDNVLADDKTQAWLSLGLQTTLGQAIFASRSGHVDHLIARSDLRESRLSLATFLDRSKLTFAETRDLERSNFLGKTSTIKFQLNAVEVNACSADAGEIMVSWADDYPDPWCGATTVARFLRLRRHLGWTVEQLDRALCSRSMGFGNLDEKFGIRLANFERLRKLLRLSVDDVLAIYCPLPTDSRDGFNGSIWWRTFLDLRVNGADLENDREALAAIKEVGLTDKRLADNTSATVQACACKLLSASLRLQKSQADEMAKQLFDHDLAGCTATKLSKLYGATIFLRATGTPLPEFAALLALVGRKVVLESPTGALRFMELNDTLKSASVSALELFRLLTAADLAKLGDVPASPARTPDEIGRAVLQLRSQLAGLSGVMLEPGPIDDVNGTEPRFVDWGKSLKMSLPNAEEFDANQLIAQLLSPLDTVMPLIEVERQRLLQQGKRLGKELPTKESLDPTRASLNEKFTQLKNGHPTELTAWLNAFYKPALEWAEVSHTDVESRILKLKELPVPRLIPQTLEEANNNPQELERLTKAFHDDLVKYCVTVTYLLSRPLQRFVLLSQRRDIISQAIGNLAKVPAELAWAIGMAVDAPKHADRPGCSASMWLLELDIEKISRIEKWPELPLDLYKQATDNRMLKLNRIWRLLLDTCLSAQFCAKLALSDEDVRWLESTIDGDSERRVDRLGGLSLNSLPKSAETLVVMGISAVDPKLVKEATEFQTLATFAKLFRAYPPIADDAGNCPPLTFCESILEPLLENSAAQPANIAKVSRSLAALTGWPLEDLQELLPATSDKLAELLLHPFAYRWIGEVIDTLARSGLRIAELQAIKMALDVSMQQGERERNLLSAAADMRKSLRKRFTEAAWLDAMKNAQDLLRICKRDALVAWLIGERPNDYADYTALSEAFLIDAEMGATMDTSRIVQAHMAVQQFVQRCQMGLETEWRIPVYAAEDWKPWKWMSRFRVWEACRKIFLYPENWMDPEIRDDKSQFFEELESDLGQGELTHENAETGVKRYLHKLHEVARLEVVATYYEFDTDTPTMHVVARTPSEPRRYFYRKWLDERVWTPWELVDLEISNDHVLVYKRNGRLYIAWISFQHKEVPQVLKSVTGPTVDPKEPLFQWRLQLTTSERAHEGWSAKKVSPDFLEWPIHTNDNVVTMEVLMKKFDPATVQPVYQDYGRPEILLLQRTAISGGNQAITPVAGNRESIGSFVLSTCNGTAKPHDLVRLPIDMFPDFERAATKATRYLETSIYDDTRDELKYIEGNVAAASYPVTPLAETPGLFSVTLAQQASLLDLSLAVAKVALMPGRITNTNLPLTMGVALPFFYSDRVTDMVVTQTFTANIEQARSKLVKGGTVDDVNSFTMKSPTVSREAQDSLNSRDIARVMDGFAKALGNEKVQQALFSNSFSAGEFLKVLRETEPRATPEKIVTILQVLTAKPGGASDGKRVFKVASRNYHPLACELVRRAEEHGIERVYSREFQLTSTESINRGRQRDGLKFLDTTLVPANYKHHVFGEFALGFDDNDAYAAYNWEVFFHIPFMTAMRFVGEGKFEDALRWFNLIFDPVAREGLFDSTKGTATVSSDAGSNPNRYWRTQRFFLHQHKDYEGQRIDILLDPSRFSSAGVPDPDHDRQLARLAASILEWRKRPNLPFQIGRGRWVAFQKAVVYRFIETIIAWADSRFRVDTREEINGATQLYFLAGKLLGRRPRTDIQMCERGSGKVSYPQSYEQLVTLIDKRDDLLSKNLDDLIDINSENFDCWENELPDSPQLNFYNEYFCVPPNEKLLELWDRVADRLRKIHSSENIDGVFRSLALFAPPIDPALLARAGALGLSIDQIIAGMNQPKMPYRFTTVLQKAMELANELRVLGGELLQALEKRDAEELGLLRSRLDLQLTRMNTETRKAQIREATEQIAAISAQLESVKVRQAWYSDQIRGGQSTKEKQSIDMTRGAMVIRAVVGVMKAASGNVSMLPTFTVGINGALGSPHSAIEISSERIAKAGDYFAEQLSIGADILQSEAGVASTLASYERREKEWKLQGDLATGEIRQLDRQLLAAQIRLAIAELELRNQERSVENSEQVDEYLKSKFTNKKLYDWMVRQISGVYFKTYQMTLDTARAAEDCLNRELPIKDITERPISVIQPGHWDGLRKGLLAANSLIHDLKRLDVEYLKRNRRTPELTKHVSLAVIDPIQLIQLRATGACEIDIPEALFDMDHPGHWGRRIKSVSMSMPCIAGPYTSISCQLSLKSSRIHMGLEKPSLENPVPSEAIYTSSGVNDSGQFELNLRDERYLPFEGAGAESTWGVRLPSKLRQFDYSSITDVVLHIRYSAVPGSSNDVKTVEDSLAEKLEEIHKHTASEGLWAMVSLRSDAPDAFNMVRMPVGSDRKFMLRIASDLLRWGGQKLGTGEKLHMFVIGDAAAPPIICDGKNPIQLGRLSGSSFWSAEVAIDDWAALEKSGIGMTLKNFSSVEDIVILVKGNVGKE